MLVESLKVLGSGETPDARQDGEKERSAVATLLVHAATADGQLEESELEVLRSLLERHYRLETSEAETLLEDARQLEAESVETYGLIRTIRETVTPETRSAIIRLMWEVAIADGEIHEFESNLIWRTAELIGVSTRDRVALRQDVLAQAGLSSQTGF